jgi:diguanylate cyclase (GGDEF)-like protein/PAS domain S-box-containing protein
MTRLRILIVEDAEWIAHALQAHLGDTTFEVVAIVPSSDLAISQVSALRPDVVLMDVILAGKLDGIEAAQYIRDYFNIPVIFLTACADKRASKAHAPCTYLLQPVTESELRLAIKMARHRHNLERRAHDPSAALTVGDGVQPPGTWEWETSTRELHFSEATCRIYGIDAKQHTLSHETFMSMVHPHDRDVVIQALQTSLNLKRSYDVYHRIVRSDASERTVHQRGCVVMSDKGIVRGIVGTTQDVTDLKRAEHRLWNQAHHDPLCDLPNRSLVFDRLKQGICHAHRERKQLAVMLFDLDNFGQVNEILGHTSGNHLLVKVARRLKDCVRECDTVARIGGNRFLLIFGGLVSETDASRVAEKLVSTMHSPFTVDGHELMVSSSIGIALFPINAGDPDELLKHAERAMLQAKQHSNNMYRFVH